MLPLTPSATPKLTNRPSPSRTLPAGLTVVMRWVGPSSVVPLAVDLGFVVLGVSRVEVGVSGGARIGGGTFRESDEPAASAESDPPAVADVLAGMRLASPGNRRRQPGRIQCGSVSVVPSGW